MTSTPFTSDVHSDDGHPEVSEISALTEDLLTEERTAALHAHLSACELCADVHASLEEIRGTLGTLPGPVRMPEDIASRIDAALAAEAMLDSAPAETDAVSRETKTGPGAKGTRQGRDTTTTRHGAAPVSRETSPMGPSRPASTRPGGRPGGSTGPGRHRPSRRTRRWRSAVLAGAGAVAVLAVGGIVVQSLDKPSNPTASPEPEPGKQNQADSALKKQVHSLLAEQKRGGTSREGAPDLKSETSPGNSPLAGGPTSLPSCVREGLKRAETPLGVDENASYGEAKGYLVVLPHQGDAERVDAYLVDGSCVRGEKSGPAEVLEKRTYPRD